ncbi:MAG: ribonuclease R [Bacteroides sp.]|nr:ribonuclease R [Ruminococcus flavefaciens]MCM1554203.1 ribonuclease R [Bacteroides sp.]
MTRKRNSGKTNKRNSSKHRQGEREARRQGSRQRQSSRDKRDNRRRHIPESLRSYITGTVDMKSTGKAYILPDNKELEDVLIMPNNVGHALHGDHVRVLVFPQRSSMRHIEGQITEVLKRNKQNIVGTVEFEGKYAYLVPDSQNMNVSVMLPSDALHGAKAGQKAVARIVSWPQHLNSPIGEITAVLGEPGDNNVEMQSILAEFDFPLEYPKEAIRQAQKMSGEVTPKDLKERRDFRDIYTCTIDPADAKDFDDALSYRKLPNGNTEIGVHIADVSHFVKPGTPIDREAYERATSVYLVDRTIPMLPERLCNDLCSLNPNQDRFCFSAVFEMDENAKVLDCWIGRGIIHSDRRFTYEEAQAIIEKAGLAAEAPKASPAPKAEAKAGAKKRDSRQDTEAVTEMFRLSKILRERRFKTGSINFHSREVRFKLEPETAKPLGVYIKESKESNHLVEEFMLLANRYVAERVGKVRGKEKAKTFVYRVHDEPNPEKVSALSLFVGKLGYKMNLKTRAGLVKSFNNLLEDIHGKAEQNMIESIAIRTMAKACYSTQNIGHYGLSFPFYTHFTSPIRRYPDLMVHRLLERYLSGGESVNQEEYEEYCLHSSDMEKRAAEAERASVKYKQAEFLSDKVGQVFPGVISGVSKWGLYVCLDENYCEGMVPLRSLNDDHYELDEDNYRVVGLHTGQTYMLGQPVRIRVQEIDMNKKQLTFSFVREAIPAPAPARRGGKRRL